MSRQTGSSSAVAEATGLSHTCVAQVERRLVRPTPRVSSALAEYFGEPIDELLRPAEEPHDAPLRALLNAVAEIATARVLVALGQEGLGAQSEGEGEGRANAGDSMNS